MCHFTIHTILFTFHYVPIKSFPICTLMCSQRYLHSTMYLLNHPWWNQAVEQIFNLHSTMYLLNQNGYGGTCTIVKKFTFHYVPIKSFWTVLRLFIILNLHSTMYLLNLWWFFCSTHHEVHLHSTMYLLNRYKMLSRPIGIQIYIPLCTY